ncbi:MAG: AAA family ATPase [Anaerovoracaceae bacterium]
MSIYLQEFLFPSDAKEENELHKNTKLRETFHSSVYPFKTFLYRGLDKIKFDENITILYGTNGSGKTTILNIIAEKISADRTTLYNRSQFFDDYVSICEEQTIGSDFDKKIITSDDIFNHILDVRSVNENIDIKRSELLKDYMEVKYSNFKLTNMDDLEELQKKNNIMRRSKSQYISENLLKKLPEISNGETAFKYFTNKIDGEGVYLLDEPENSLSPTVQLELKRFIEDSARFYGCQFIIATHSPFLLALNGAKVYDLDETPVVTKKWTELDSVKTYNNFFLEHKNEFID